MTRREQIRALLDGADTGSYVPAAFFLHFESTFHTGKPAVEKHLEFFRHTGMDFVKIQFELDLPADPEIKSPGDWSRVSAYGRDYYQGVFDIVSGLVAEAGAEAPVIMTLYSPFMCAGQISGRDTLLAHLRDDPDAVKAGMDQVTESVINLARGCIDSGADGFYASSQGAEQGLFSDPAVYEQYIRPADLKVWEAIDSCWFNILHVCDYHGRYADLSQHLGYPGHVVNCGLEMAGGKTLTPTEVSQMFGRPLMGGLDRHGVLAKGDSASVKAAAKEVLATVPDRFILGADCTVPADTSWDNLKAAIEVAHGG